MDKDVKIIQALKNVLLSDKITIKALYTVVADKKLH